GALAFAGVSVTVAVMWLAVGKLAADYETGLRTLGEAVPQPQRRSRRRWLRTLVEQPPLRWCLRDPVARASFLLVISYLFRDRDVKLRIYPALAPLLVVPIVFLVQTPARAQPDGRLRMA